MPLVDVHASGDGTEFWAGSHTGAGLQGARRGIRPDGTLRESAAATAPLESPACPKGGVIIFDYRVVHRGRPATQRDERPIAYCVCSTGGASDTANFPQLSLADSEQAARYAEITPFWDEDDDVALANGEEEESDGALFDPC